ncbi:HAMP domain-containing sensor histidine kinase [Devosia epidermidihirudinis]|uniref:HAMP domain-containing sensor histidine kinase n=1 Tax=Devosia epidermidihirudinis TaxID=1293439 RepID=UPI00069A5B68|nr:HAMP domain-containing sensor histidine kinase [Devosia epidermidihirudinis]
MSRANPLTGSAFRSSLFVLIMTAAVLAGAGWLILTTSRAALVDQLKARILEDFELVRQAQAANGEAGLAQFVRAAGATQASTRYVVGMFTTNGTPLIGNLTEAPDFTGWATRVHNDREFLEFVEQLQDHTLVLGRSTEAVELTVTEIVRALLMAGLVVGAAGLAIGYALSRRVSQKLELLADGLEAVSRGDASARIPVGAGHDQIDHLAEQINVHLERLSRLMDTMRSTAIAIAHDLKTPLNRASLLLQQAVDEPDNRSDLVLQADAELLALQNTMDTILRISRIESSGERSSFIAFPLRELLTELYETYQPVAEDAQQSLTLVDGPEVTAFGDRRMIVQLVVNLIENSNRYAGAGAQIALACAETPAGAVIVVRDTGPGIPAAQREAVFRPFVRLEAERRSEGTGLGLALVQAIVTRHRGTITLADNAPGLVVTVTLPRGK